MHSNEETQSYFAFKWDIKTTDCFLSKCFIEMQSEQTPGKNGLDLWTLWSEWYIEPRHSSTAPWRRRVWAARTDLSLFSRASRRSRRRRSRSDSTVESFAAALEHNMQVPGRVQNNNTQKRKKVIKAQTLADKRYMSAWDYFWTVGLKEARQYIRKLNWIPSLGIVPPHCSTTQSTLSYWLMTISYVSGPRYIQQKQPILERKIVWRRKSTLPFVLWDPSTINAVSFYPIGRGYLGFVWNVAGSKWT